MRSRSNEVSAPQTPPPEGERRSGFIPPVATPDPFRKKGTIVGVKAGVSAPWTVLPHSLLGELSLKGERMAAVTT